MSTLTQGRARCPQRAILRRRDGDTPPFRLILLLLLLAIPAAFAGDAEFTFDPVDWQLSPAGRLLTRAWARGHYHHLRLQQRR